MLYLIMRRIDFEGARTALISPDDSIRSLVGRLFPNSNPNLSAHMNLQFSTSGVANFIEGDLEDASFN